MVDAVVTYSNGSISLGLGRESVNLTRQQAIDLMSHISTALSAQSAATPGSPQQYMQVQGVQVDLLGPSPTLGIVMQMTDRGNLAFALTPETAEELCAFLQKGLAVAKLQRH